MKSNNSPVLLAGIIAAFAGKAVAVAVYGQCGGIGYTGSTVCDAGSVCTVSNPYYSQCLPGTAPPTTSATTTTKPITSATGSATSTSSSPATTNCSTNTPPSSAGSVKFGGVNIAGFDFGCGTDGTCSLTGTSKPYPPLASLGNPDGIGQMQHFVSADKFNIFRLPVGWQYLTNGVLGGTLNSNNLATYDQLVQGCLATGAYCIIDIHNYARWNGGIIGQGGPTNAQFTNLWSQLAAKYAGTSKIIFGVVNEPHDIPNITTWAATVQAVVTAIRQAGANSQIILLPGNNWTSAGTFISSGSAAALDTVTNPDGSKTNLVFDVHKYLDSDNSGTSTTCTTNNVNDAFAPLAQWLRCHGRQALNTETGGGNTASCITDLGQQLAFLNANSDVFLGFVGWSAGSFDATYALTETPTKNGNSWVDTTLVSQALAPNFHP